LTLGTSPAGHTGLATLQVTFDASQSTSKTHWPAMQAASFGPRPALVHSSVTHVTGQLGGAGSPGPSA
jgi:hypothetical protein